MIRMSFAAIICLAILPFGLPANAYEAPWCAVYSTDQEGVYWDCQYRSFEECLTERAGKSWLVQSEPVLCQFSDGVPAPQENSRSCTVGLQRGQCPLLAQSGHAEKCNRCRYWG